MGCFPVSGIRSLGGMVDWTQPVDTVIGVILGGGLASTWLEVRHHRRTERDSRRERYAELLGDLETLLVDADTIRRTGALIGGLVTKEVLEESKEWIETKCGRLRRPLSALANGHPSPEVQNLARRLQAALVACLHTAWWGAQEQGSPQLADLAKEKHEEAQRLLGELQKAI
jgi:hypothetical protein